MLLAGFSPIVPGFVVEPVEAGLSPLSVSERGGEREQLKSNGLPSAVKAVLSVDAPCLRAMTFVREYGTRLLSWWRRPAHEPALRAYLAPEFAAEPFTDECIAIVPTAPGVYLLYSSGRLIYVGIALSGIRQELERHRRGAHGGGTRHATAFHYELTANPERAYREYLRAHMARYGGQLPPCNAKGSP